MLADTHDVTLCVNTNAYPLAEDVASVVRVLHIDIARKIAPLKDLWALFQLLRHFREKRPTVVHSMTPKAGLIAMLAAWLTNVPWRFHTFTGQVWANKSGVGRVLFKTIDKLIAVCASRVFADSISQCRFLEDQGVVRRGGVGVLGHGSVAGVDPKRFCRNIGARAMLRAELDVADESPVFIFVGRLVRDKGVFDLIDAIASLNDQHPLWELWMIGPDEEGIQADLEARAMLLGARVRWFGSTSNPEHYMAAADVFVLPSYREGFGSVIIEAAACGIPCVAYRIDGVIDAIVENYTGLFIDKGDVRGLSASMKRLGSDAGMRQRLGEAARIRAVKDFSSSAISAAWRDFYSAIFKDLA